MSPTGRESPATIWRTALRCGSASALRAASGSRGAAEERDQSLGHGDVRGDMHGRADAPGAAVRGGKGQQSPNIVPLAGASRPASIRDSAAGLDLTHQDLEDLRAPKEQRTPP